MTTKEIKVKSVQEVDFPKFTSSLIQGVFETIQNNHLLQIKSYSELLKETSEDIAIFASKNYLGVPNESIAEFLQRPIELTDASSTSQSPLIYLSIDEWFLAPTTITSSPLPDPLPLEELSDYTPLNEFLSAAALKETAISKTTSREDVMILIRKKIVSENHVSLQEMVRLGMLRIVTDEITIKSRLVFNAWESHVDNKHDVSATYSSKGYHFGGRAGYSSRRFGIRLWGGYSNVKTTVDTSSSYSANNSGANLNLMGYVKIKAHTDYQSLSA